MIPASTDEPLVTFTRFTRDWFRLLAHGAFDEAAACLDEPNLAGKWWSGADIRDTLNACARCATMEVSNPDSTAGDGHPVLDELVDGRGYTFEQEVPMDGEWSDAIVQFEFLRRPEGYAVVLENIHVQ